MKRLAVAVLALLIVGACRVAAQTIHLPPAFSRDVPPTETVLRVTRSSAAATLSAATTFTVDNDHLVVSTGAGVDRILIKNRTLADVVADIRAKYGSDVVATTSYPLLTAEALESSVPAQFVGDSLRIKAGPSNPQAQVGFGVVLGLSESSTETGGLLSQTGFQLDLAGVHQLRTPGVSSTGIRSVLDQLQVFAQVRVGLSADQQLVAAEPDSGSSDPVGDQFDAAIQQADQVSLTGQLDFVWPVQRRMEFGLTFGFGINWTQPEIFVMPSIVVRDTARSPEALFGNERVTRLTDRLNAPAALNDKSVLAVFRFHSGRSMSYYVGGGIVDREVLVRGFSIRRLDGGGVDSTFLQPRMNGSHALFWQAVFGINIPGVVDVRLDGVGPTQREFERPVLRLVLSRAFPAS